MKKRRKKKSSGGLVRFEPPSGSRGVLGLGLVFVPLFKRCGDCGRCEPLTGCMGPGLPANPASSSPTTLDLEDPDQLSRSNQKNKNKTRQLTKRVANGKRL